MMEIFTDTNHMVHLHFPCFSAKNQVLLESIEGYVELDHAKASLHYYKNLHVVTKDSRWFSFPANLHNVQVIDRFVEFSNFHPGLYANLTALSGKENGMSTKTIQAYSAYTKIFFERTKKKYRDVTKEDMNEFLVYIIEKKNPASSTVHLMISSLHFFFRQATKLFVDLKIERPKKERNLPEILQKEEVFKIIRATDNSKHKALLSLVYSSGLRVSEVVKLRVEDIDKDRKILRVFSSKGKLDRTTILSKMGIIHVEDYLSQVGHPMYLFPGQDSMKCISIRTAEKIFEAAKKKAGIQKRVSIHSLRHAFATHLLESGQNIKYIQNLLGHKNLQTTQIYKLISEKVKLNQKEQVRPTNLNPESPELFDEYRYLEQVV